MNNAAVISLLCIFMVYLLMFFTEKCLQAASDQNGTFAVTVTRIALLFLFLIVLMLGVSFSTTRETGSVSNALDHDLTSGLVVLMLIILSGINMFSYASLSKDSDVKSDESLAFLCNAIFVTVLLGFFICYNYLTYSKRNRWMLTNGIIYVVTMVVYVVLTYRYIKSSATKSRAKVFRSVFSVGMISLFFTLMPYVVMILHRSILTGLGNNNKIIDSVQFLMNTFPLTIFAQTCGFVLALTLGSLRLSLAKKLVNVQDGLPDTWVYTAIVKYIIDEMIQNILNGSENLSVDNIIAALKVTDPNLITTFNLSDPVPLDLNQKINDLLSTQLNRSPSSPFKLVNFLSKWNSSIDITSDKLGLTVNITAGVVLFVIGLWLAYNSFTATEFFSMKTLYTVLQCGVAGYGSYWMLMYAQEIDNENVLFCFRNGIDESACAAKRNDFLLASGSFGLQIGLIENGTGSNVIVNGVDVFGGTPMNNDSNPNLSVISGLIGKYLGDDPLGQYQLAFSSLVTFAQSIDLQRGADDESLFVFSPSPEYIDGAGTGKQLGSVSMKEIIDLLTDVSNFALSNGLAPYRLNTLTSAVNPSGNPAANKAPSSNDYYSIASDKNGITNIFWNYEKKGLTFKNDLMTVLRIAINFQDCLSTATIGSSSDPLTYPGTDYSTRPNLKMWSQMIISGQLSVSETAATSSYITVIKNGMRVLIQDKLTSSMTIDQIWETLMLDENSWDRLKSSQSQNSGYDVMIPISQSSLASSDKITLIDLLHHAIDPRVENVYDLYINEYFQKLFLIVKIELASDLTQFTPGIDRLEKAVKWSSYGSIWLSSIVWLVLISAGIGITINFPSGRAGILDYVQDYFTTSIDGKSSNKFNPILISILLVCLGFNLFEYINIYQYENQSIGSVLYTSNSLWGGKYATPGLIAAIVAILLFVPVCFRDAMDRKLVFGVSTVFIAMLVTPLVYTNMSCSSISQIGSLAMLGVCAALFLLLISIYGKLIPNSGFSVVGFVAIIIVATISTSVPANILKSFYPSMSDEEIKARLRAINDGVFASAGTLVILFIIYFFILKRTPLFVNTITTLDLPPILMR